jgi:hypothetical protein
VGQERRLVNPPSQVVAGVRTVTTNMDGRDVLPRLSRPFAFLSGRPNHFRQKVHARMRTPKQALIGPKGLQAKQELGIAAIESQRPGAFL